MSDVIIFDRIQLRQGTAADLAAVNEVLREGEICIETDTAWPGGGRKFKIGDGSTAWNALSYAVPDVSAGAGGAMTLVGTATVAGAAATTLTLAGLNLSSDGRYLIEFAFGNATASGASLSLFYNADTTATNYYRSANFGASTNDAFAATLDSSGFVTGNIRVMMGRDSKAKAISEAIRYTSTPAIAAAYIHHAYKIAANVTSITISSSVAASLAIGSYFKVWKIT